MIRASAGSTSVVWAVAFGLSLSAGFPALAGPGDVARYSGKPVQSNSSTASSGRRPLAVRIAMAEKVKAQQRPVAAVKADTVKSEPTTVAGRPSVPRLLLDCEESTVDARHGDTIRWKITIRNAGAVATHVIGTLYFAEGIEPTGAEGLPHSLATGEVRFHPIEALGPDETIQLEVVGRAVQPGSVAHRIEVGCRELSGHVAREAVILIRPKQAE